MSWHEAMKLEHLLVAAAAAALLVLAFLFAVRQGRFASPGARIAALVVITIIFFLLIGFGPALYPAR